MLDCWHDLSGQLGAGQAHSCSQTTVAVSIMSTANPNNETIVQWAKAGYKNSAVTSLDDVPGQRQRASGGHKTGVMAWMKNTRNIKWNDIEN